jgi:hypothetical protein
MTANTQQPDDLRQSRLADYREFHRLQVVTGDIDPVYPVLEQMGKDLNLTRDELAWLVLCHVAWYHLGSALAVFSRIRRPSQIPTDTREMESIGLTSWPTGTERRGHRDSRKLVVHLQALRNLPDEGLAGWPGLYGWGWNAMRSVIETVPGNGRWASYKTAEMWRRVVGYGSPAPDAGHADSSGPRKTLGLLYPGMPALKDNRPWAIAQLDAATDHLAGVLREPDVSQVETSLCDFGSLLKGNYYVGHDIDQMLGQLNQIKYAAPLMYDAAIRARRQVFAAEALGEGYDPGWTGVRKGLRRYYIKDGKTLDPAGIGSAVRP